MAQLHIHSSLTRFTNNQSDFEFNIPSVQDLIATICEHIPNLAQSILDNSGELIPYVNCYIDGKNVQSLCPSTQLHADSKIELVTALVGG